MLEILLLLVLAITMARKPAKRRRFNLRPVRVSPSLALVTLASGIVLSSNLWPAADQAYVVTSFTGSYSLRGHTAGEGPLHIGLSHGDYTVTEIKEAIESTSISAGSMIEREQSRRLVRIVGTFNGLNTEEVLNDGKPMKTKLNWFIPIGKELKWFVYNDSGATLTTGAVADITGTGWVRDT